MTIYCHSNLDESLQAKLKEALPADYNIHFASELSETEAHETFRTADYILGNPPVSWFSIPLDNLKFWQLDSAGFDQYSFIQLNEGTKVANMGDWFARPCAESIVGGVLALYRGIDTLTILKQKKEWVGVNLRPMLRILCRQNVVILGAGTIGQSVNTILNGLGCNTQMMARTSPAATINTLDELYEVLPTTDLVINTLPGTAVHFANADLFAKMKAGSVFARVGRGSTPDENALIEAFTSTQLEGAVLDVTEIEPLPTESPLWTMENVILTQHTGGGHRDEHIGKVDSFLNNVFALENGSNVMDEVTLARGY
jgi:glyoxylate/hydroxypyruvate reductase A